MYQRENPSLELLSAYVDGELTPDECARVEQLVATHDDYRQALADFRALARDMKGLPAYRLGPSFATRVIDAAHQLEPPQTDPQPSAEPGTPLGRATSVWHWPAAVGVLTAAAALALAIMLLRGTGPDPGLPEAHPRLAQSHNQDAADAQVAAVPAPEAPAESDAEPTTPWAPPAAPGGVDDPQLARARRADSPPQAAAQPAMGHETPAVGVDVAHAVPGQVSDGHIRPSADAPPDLQVPALLGAQQLLLVVDVALTRQGAEQGAFEQMLGAQGIALEQAVSVDKKLEETLLASRFFDPVAAQPDESAGTAREFSLMYVRTQAGKMDDLWRAIQTQQGDFSRITLDMAFLADDQSMFQDLRRAVQTPSDRRQPAGVPRAAAHRLLLSPDWPGARRAPEGPAAGVPAWMLGQTTPEQIRPADMPDQPQPGQPLADMPPSPGGRLGENVEAELLFVVHVGR